MDALASLLARPEGKTAEHKRDLTSPQSVLRTLIAFANTAGGTLLIGVEDGTRDVVGVDDVLAVEERLANLVADSIAPRLLPDIEIHPWRQTQVITATVYPGGSQKDRTGRRGLRPTRLSIWRPDLQNMVIGDCVI